MKQPYKSKIIIVFHLNIIDGYNFLANLMDFFSKVPKPRKGSFLFLFFIKRERYLTTY